MALASAARAERLVDLAPTLQVRLELRWSDFDTRRGDADPAFHQMSGSLASVEYRLDVGRHVGQRVRIDYVLPADPGFASPQAMLVRWSTRGLLRPGQGRPGDRVTVFEGILREPLLMELFDLQFLVDSRYFDGRFRFAPHFELDVLP